MTRSLAEIRAAKSTSRSTRSLTVCLAPHLVAEVQNLTEQIDNLPSAAPVIDGEKAIPPRRLVSTEDPRAAGLRARLKELLEEMAEYEGEFRFRATTDGEWRRWANDHPGRDEGEPGHQRDAEVTYGYCDADALINALGTYAYSWNGEVLQDGDWEILAESMSAPDKKQAATTVTSMHESALNLGKWRSGLQDSLSRYSASVSPALSPSAPDDSTAGSPSGSSTATTETVPA